MTWLRDLFYRLTTPPSVREIEARARQAEAEAKDSDRKYGVLLERWKAEQRGRLAAEQRLATLKYNDMTSGEQAVHDWRIREHERETRELWRRVATEVAGTVGVGRTLVPVRWADDIAAAYNERFDPRVVSNRGFTPNLTPDPPSPSGDPDVTA